MPKGRKPQSKSIHVSGHIVERRKAPNGRYSARKVSGASATGRDIAEHREKNIGLEKNRTELQATKVSQDEAREYAESIINTVREPLIVLDQDLRVVTASRSFYEVFKVKPEETVGQLIYDLGNKQWDIPKLRELLETILPQKTTFDNYEVEHDFSTIGRRIMLLNARQIQRVLGKERIILLVIEDITERKEIEAGLEKTRQELEVIKRIADEASEFSESIINTVREPLIALDQDLRVVSVSRSFYEVFKVNPKETVGQLIYDLGNKQWDIPKLRELLETILPQKTTFDNYEVEHDFSTIGRRIMLLNARQIQRVLGKERIILLAIDDITETKKLERGVVQARDAAEAANKELEAFSYSVSHDLRAPLRSIDGFSKIIMEEYSNKLDAEGKRLLNIIRSNTQKMGELITDLLSLSHVTRDEMKFSRVDMTTLANSIYCEVAPTDVQKQYSFIIESLPEAYCDPALMRQVWRNLISNAIKFTAPKDARRIDIGGCSKDGTNEYFIKDSGVGFDPRYTHKLFGVFQRLHKVEEFEGTGVGLAIVQRIVHRHGGHVWAEGVVGQGATFLFSLPSQEKNHEQQL
jgi:PAS domain S-box-containing protein